MWRVKAVVVEFFRTILGLLLLVLVVIFSAYVSRFSNRDSGGILNKNGPPSCSEARKKTEVDEEKIFRFMAICRRNSSSIGCWPPRRHYGGGKRKGARRSVLAKRNNKLTRRHVMVTTWMLLFWAARAADFYGNELLKKIRE